VAFRESFFQDVSIISCTGFATVDKQLWPTMGWVIIFFLMFFGGSTFILWYLALFIAGSLLMVFLGSDVATASSAVATAMGGIGPGLGTIGPVSNFAHLSEASKIVLSALMLLGRLEIYTIVMLFTPWFWGKQ